MAANWLPVGQFRSLSLAYQLWTVVAWLAIMLVLVIKFGDWLGSIAGAAVAAIGLTTAGAVVWIPELAS